MLLITVLFRGLIGRLSIVLGVVVGYIAAVAMGEVDFSTVNDAAWIGLPAFHAVGNPFADPTLWGLLPAFLPVVLVLIAEKMADDAAYRFDRGASAALEAIFSQARRSPSFGNARFARQLF